jgi:hypothetical protein
MTKFPFLHTITFELYHLSLSKFDVQLAITFRIRPPIQLVNFTHTSFSEHQFPMYQWILYSSLICDRVIWHFYQAFYFVRKSIRFLIFQDQGRIYYDNGMYEYLF